MFEEFVDHMVKVVSLDGKEFSGVLAELAGDFIKLINLGNTYVINTKYIGYLKPSYIEQAQQTDHDPEMYPAAGYQYPARVAAKVTPRSNEFSMDMPTPEETAAPGGPQLIRQTSRRSSSR